MVTIKRLFVATLVSLSLSLVSTSKAKAISFTFTRIADTTGNFSDFDTSPSINDNGTVAFWGLLRGSGTINDGVFTGNGTDLTTIATVNRPFVGGPAINNNGTVAFTDFDGVFTGSGTDLTTIATVDRPFFGFGPPAINNNDTVAFSGGTQGVQESIFTGNGKNLTTIAEANGSQKGLGFNVGINNSDTVVFVGNPDNLEPGVFISNGGITTTIANTSSGFFNTFNSAAINDSGTVVFNATLTPVGLSSGIFTLDNGTLTTIANTSGPFSFFGQPAINNGGTVAFYATLFQGGSGIFVGSDPVSDKVIATGDSLEGSTVTSALFFSNGLNNFGQLAFYAKLADGTSGIFRADPVAVPEGSSVLALLTVGALSAGLRLTRQNNS